MKNLNKFLLSCVLIVTVFLFIQKNSLATVFTIDAPLSGMQEVPPNPSTGLGSITGTYNDVTRILLFDLVFTGLLSPTVAAHLHAPAPRGVNAPIVIGFVGFPVGVTSGFFTNRPVGYTLTPAQNIEIVGGLWYVNIHTSASPGGEIRGQLEEGTLPVELSSFSANVLKNTVSLKWSTTVEINNSGFDVERKLSSSTEWAKVGNVAGNNNSNELKNYSYSERVATGIYNYRLKQIDFNGNFQYFNLSNEVNVGVPASYNISQNYPNPFNPTTKIDYELPYDGKVSIILYDISGKEMSSLVNEVKTAGFHTVQVNANNLSSGSYFYKIFAQNGNGNFIMTKKMTVIK